MGKRVYDPIHDVFQDTEESETERSATGRPVEGEEDSNTESEETHSPQKEPIVPSVVTNRKRMKESSKYNRHLKKPDGEFFTRSDLQFHFLTRLLTDDRPLFTNIFKELYAKTLVPLPITDGKTMDVTDSGYDARTFVFNDKLTFSQLYILTLASSTKCSKVLRDKLLLDHQVAFSTCVLALLVNFGRLNTTINFYLEMTSQLRTFHSVPCLQYQVADLKSLQDTPRLKSILKNLSVGNEPLDLAQLYESPGNQRIKANVVNLLFTMCDNVSLVNLKLLSKYVATPGSSVSLFNILDSSEYEPTDRCNVILWLLYVHTETDLSDEALRRSIKLFTDGDRLPLERASKDYDEDPQEEYDFGMEQKVKRKEFLRRTKQDESDGKEDEEEGEQEQEPEQEEEEEEDETIQEVESQEEESSVPEPVTPRKRREPVREKREPKRRKVEPAVKQESSGEDASKIQSLIEMDRTKIVGKLGRHKTKDQQTFVQDLLSAQQPVKLKRRDLGLVRIFNEYEDITMASVIGIRGKKRKKFKDDVLGFETDFLRSFAAAKKMLLNLPDRHEDPDQFFQL